LISFLSNLLSAKYLLIESTSDETQILIVSIQFSSKGDRLNTSLIIMQDKKVILQPPNGSWGWIVVLGAVLTNIFNEALVGSFGLMFKSHFDNLNEPPSKTALVLNICNAVGNMAGLIVGPILKTYSARKVAVTGCLLTSCGIMLSAFTTSLWQIIITFSVMVGIGLGLIGPAVFITVMSYFTTKRNRAISFALSGTIIGQMVLPQIITQLSVNFGSQKMIFAVGCLSLTGLAGISLFQPVRRHMKKVEVDAEFQEVKKFVNREKAGDETKPSIFKHLTEIMDLDLLKDLKFISLNFGLACGYLIGIDFMLIFPFFLQVRTESHFLIVIF
jgi:MFS family permease